MLVGSLVLFVLLAAAMYLTRRAAADVDPQPPQGATRTHDFFAAG
jgi:hypothetical protein